MRLRSVANGDPEISPGSPAQARATLGAWWIGGGVKLPAMRCAITDRFLLGVQWSDGPDAGHPFDLPVIQNLRRQGGLEFTAPVTFFVGENGSGKSTLLEALAVACGLNAEGGSRNFRFATRASHSPLHECLRLVRSVRKRTDDFFLRAESFYNTATEIETLGVTGYGDRNLHQQSHGESFLSILMERFRGNGLYFLDEPEAALSAPRQLTALARINQLAHEGSQLIIATHSPILLALPGAQIMHFSVEGIHPIAYEHTDAYAITRRFLTDTDGMLRRILGDGEGGNGGEKGLA